jgi:hypothetical protein
MIVRLHILNTKQDRGWDTEDPYTHLRSSRRIELAAKVVGVMVIVALLMVPLVVLYFVTDPRWRLGIIVLATLLVALFLALLTRSRRFEVFAGTAALVNPPLWPAFRKWHVRGLSDQLYSTGTVPSWRCLSPISINIAKISH